MARNIVDLAWPAYDGSPEQAEARDALIDRAIDTAFPRHGVALNDTNLRTLAAAARAARRSQLWAVRLWHEGKARHAREPSAAADLAAWGAGVAARQAGDWVRLVDELLVSVRRYRVVEGNAAGPSWRRRAAQRFAKRCATELGIITPEVLWIRPVEQGGDLVTIGDIAGCAPKSDRSVIFVRSDILTERERLRVVAHEVAHHSGADEGRALAYERAALRRHTAVPLHHAVA